MKKILLVIGTRPEAIKMFPLVNELKKFNQIFEVKLCVTAQHREMLDSVLSFFSIIPDYDLNIMKSKQTLSSISADIISGLEDVFKSFNPDYTFVHGDTTTTFASAISAFYHGSKVCHVEAGLRTYNKKSPFPEEINRQLVSRISDYHYSPTIQSSKNLLNEGISDSTIVVTGNTVIDALNQTLKIIYKNPSLIVKSLTKKINNREIILVTGHRRENHGQGFENICRALKVIASRCKDHVIIYPVHLNPNVKNPVQKNLSGIKNILLINPLDYPDFVWLMNESKIILTDSGGVQEEAPSLGKPVIVLRDNTERPEAVIAGTVILAGTNENKIIDYTLDLIENQNKYVEMSNKHNPYGDGLACSRIVNHLLKL